jgi:hypothetical protein
VHGLDHVSPPDDGGRKDVPMKSLWWRAGERFPGVPTDDAVSAFIAANPKYAAWPARDVRAVMMGQESDRLHLLRRLQQENEEMVENRQWRLSRKLQYEEEK